MGKRRRKEDIVRETMERANVMVGFANGEVIECRLVGDETWRRVTTPKWNWQRFEYRFAQDSHPGLAGGEVVFLIESASNWWCFDAAHESQARHMFKKLQSMGVSPLRFRRMREDE